MSDNFLKVFSKRNKKSTCSALVKIFLCVYTQHDHSKHTELVKENPLRGADFLLHVILFITARGEDLCHSGLLQWCVPVLWLWIMQYSNSLEYNIWLWQHCRNMWHFISSTNSVQNPPTAMLFTAWGPHRDWSVVFMMKFIGKKKKKKTWWGKWNQHQHPTYTHTLTSI